MRVFILCTGRSGSVSFVNACKFMDNYTTAHESRTTMLGPERLQYADQHIEGDNRLSWHLGQLDSLYGDDAFYVHLKRNREKVAVSHLRRYFQPGSIIDAFCEGIKKTPPEKLSDEERLQACYDYVDTITANIDFFLANKRKTQTIYLEDIKREFPLFWKNIGASGDLESAINSFDVRHNASKKRVMNYPYRFKLLWKREWQHLKMWFQS